MADDTEITCNECGAKLILDKVVRHFKLLHCDNERCSQFGWRVTHG